MSWSTSPVKQLTILGRRWRLTIEKLNGLCGDCCIDPREIRIDPRLPPLEALDTLVHEMLHAAGWHLDEEYVERFASDVARAAHRLGLVKEEE